MSWVFFSHGKKEYGIRLYTDRGSITLESLDVYELNSVWKEALRRA